MIRIKKIDELLEYQKQDLQSYDKKIKEAEESENSELKNILIGRKDKTRQIINDLMALKIDSAMKN